MHIYASETYSILYLNTVCLDSIWQIACVLCGDSVGRAEGFSHAGCPSGISFKWSLTVSATATCRRREHTPAHRRKKACVPSSVPALGRPLLAFSGSAPASVAVRRFCPDGTSAAGADASEHPARGGCVWTCSPRIALDASAWP